MHENWRPSASLDTLTARARILHDIRVFFATRNVLEVNVPSITFSGVTDVNIDSVSIHLNNQVAFLHTSPEYPMKRLLAAGFGDCYYLGSVFRLGEQGQRHNPEFTMLEWYRLQYSMQTLIDEVVALITNTLPLGDIIYQSLSYYEALLKVTQLDVFTCSIESIQQCLVDFNVDTPKLSTRDEYLDLLMSVVVIPALTEDKITTYSILCLHSYPPSQAALAQITQDAENREVAARFEIIVNGLEVANGYQECQDAWVLQQRFREDNKSRKDLNRQQMPLDTKFIAAHEHGLPACSGVALGVDRLCMLALGKETISEVIAFPFNRC